MKEELIKKIEDFKSGDVVLVRVPMFPEDSVGTVTAITPTDKYPFTESKSGKKGRMENRKTIYAEDEGCTGDEMIKELDIWIEGGSVHITEMDDIESFNVRRISEDHPKYDKDIAKAGSMMGNIFSEMAQVEENGEDILDPSFLMSMMGNLDPSDEEE